MIRSKALVASSSMGSACRRGRRLTPTAAVPRKAAWTAFVAHAAIALTVAGCTGPSRPLQLLSGADLAYPDQARAAGVEGVVRVRYDVTVDGRVVNAEVDAADPAGVFDAAALALVRSWRFRPAVEDGESVAAPARISEVRFQLGDTDRYDRSIVGPE